MEYSDGSRRFILTDPIAAGPTYSYKPTRAGDGQNLVFVQAPSDGVRVKYAPSVNGDVQVGAAATASPSQKCSDAYARETIN